MYQDLINSGFGSQFRKEKRVEKRQEVYAKIALVVLGIVIIYAFYSVDIIVNRAIDLM